MGSGRSSVRRASVVDPGAIDALLDEGGRRYAAGHLDQAETVYRRALETNRDDPRALYSLAVIDLRRGRLAQARRGFAAVARADKAHFAARHNLGVAAQGLGLWAEAERSYGKALALDPDAAESRFALARVLAIQGRTSQAVGQYRILAGAPPSRARALGRLGILAPEAVDDEEFEALRRGARDGAIDGETRILLLFALGQVLESRASDEAAFAAFAEGNRLKREALGGAVAATAQAHARSIAVQKARFTKAFVAGRDPAASVSAAPIFIVGFPRCGSSLIEQILASHRDVQGMGESGALGAVLAGPATAAAYLKAMRDHGLRDKKRFVDKTLENFLHVGSIHRLFPRAVIIHAARDPLDTCLACWRQLFATGAETLYDLVDIGAEYRRYREMMDHWRAVLPGRTTEVRLEALVASPEGEIRRLIQAACGLPWDRACLRFWENARPVRTASAAQVRRPISGQAVGRWRRYEAHLGPLVDHLGSLRTLADGAADQGS
ncbi:MAG: tetratricopeptide repeat-containing sulfotransferase family protein [Caulobacteraceae bacterium]